MEKPIGASNSPPTKSNAETVMVNDKPVFPIVRPHSAMILFLNEYMKKIGLHNAMVYSEDGREKPYNASKDVMTEEEAAADMAAANIWTSMSVEEKAPYENVYNEKLAKWENDVKEWEEAMKVWEKAQGESK